MYSLGVQIAMGIIMVVQLLAIGYALRLVHRTKYSIIWILCVIAFAVSFAQHLLYIFLNRDFNSGLILTLDVAASLCIVAAVLFAHRLINHIDHLNQQRNHLSKQLLSAVVRTEERSRSQFAKELHDGMGPLLSSAKMSLSAISTENMNKEQQEILASSRHMIDEAIRSVREISNNMSPQVLEDFGLSRGVHNFISRLQSFYDVEIEFRSGIHNERFDHNVEVVLYRVICELINNSLKHSGCKNIDISLLLKDATIELCYLDNGCGFDTTTAMSKGMGLSNITSRISSLNGDLQIESGIGKGLKVVARINTKQDDVITHNQRKRRWKKR